MKLVPYSLIFGINIHCFILVYLLCQSSLSYSNQNGSESNKIENRINLINNLIDVLDDATREKLILDLDNEDRQHWHYYPDIIPRKGLRLKELSKEKIFRIMNILENVLSEQGTEKTKRIIDLENILFFRSGSSSRDPLKYYFTLFGKPSNKNLWGLQFEGHHISLNFLFNGNQIVSSAPRFFGANPSIYTDNSNKKVDTLKQEEYVARKLVLSMSESQKDKTIFSSIAPPDIVTGTKARSVSLKPKGINFTDLNSEQKKKFLQLINVYLDVLPEKEKVRIESRIFFENLEFLFFAWAGGIQPGQGHYYRIQGKDFIIEYDNTQENANHIHTVWRDLDNDFGRRFLSNHYKNHH